MRVRFSATVEVPENAPLSDVERWLKFEAYCGAVARLRDAQRRIADEGAIVPDGKQNPVPHPALAIERQCMEQLRKWGSKFT